MTAVLFERRGPLAIVRLNRPDSLNAFAREQRLELRDHLLRVAEDRDVRAVVLTGSGRGFSAGAELKGEEAPSGAEVEVEINDEYAPSLLALATMPKPAIAAVNGFAAGIGMSFALACDLVVMGESAFLQAPFSRLGLVPDGGACWQLADRLGYRRAFELAVAAERIPAARCLEWGLANRIVADDRVLEEACAWAEKLATGAPGAIALTKALLRRAPQLGLEGTIRAEATAQSTCIDTADFREGVAAFREKRPAVFTGR